MLSSYFFGGDENFLREHAYPLMKSAARFIFDFLVEAPEGTPFPGKLITNPSHFPENVFDAPDGTCTMFTYAVTMANSHKHRYYQASDKIAESEHLDKST